MTATLSEMTVDGATIAWTDTGTGEGKRRVWEASTRGHEWTPSDFAGDDDAEASLTWLNRHYQSQLAQRAEGWVALVDYALPKLKEAGIDVVFNEYTNAGERDFRVYLLKIKAAKPDMIWAPITSPEVDILFKQMREAGLNIPITGYFTALQPESFKYAQGVEYYSDTWVRPDFLECFTKRFGHAPIIRAGHAYDLIKMYITEAEAL